MWTPKRKGRAMVWVQELFLEDNEGRPVCTTHKSPESVGSGNSNANTTNLIHLYTGQKADELQHEDSRSSNPADPGVNAIAVTLP